jgi:hypothetical protein
LGLVTDTSISRCVRVRWTGKSQEKDEGQWGKRKDGRKDTDYNTYLSDTTHGVAVDFFRVSSVAFVRIAVVAREMGAQWI